MTLPGALEGICQADADSDVDGAGPILHGRVPAEVIETLHANRDRVIAVLQLRAVHRAIELTEGDVLFVEQALLAGRELDVRVVARPPSGPLA
jgi:hypothetical protein